MATTTETAKRIREQLKATFPDYKFSVRKISYGVINIQFNGDETIRPQVYAIANAHEGWDHHATEYVFVNAYGKQVA